MKLRRLPKLCLIRKYTFILPKSYLFARIPKLYDIKIDNDEIKAKGSKKAYLFFKDKEDVKIINNYAYYFNNKFINHFFIYLTGILCFLILLGTKLFIKDVRFVNELSYDLRIETFIYDNLDKTIFGYVYKDDLNVLSAKLKIAFPEYPYIGVYKNATKLYIDVIPYPSYEEVTIKKEKSLYAKSNGLITSFIVKEGKVLCEINQMVKKGELLIEPSSKDIDNYVCGYVFAKTCNYEKIKVPKEMDIYAYTGKRIERKVICVNNKELRKTEIEYPDYEYSLNQIFKIGKICIYDEYIYEKKMMRIIHTNDSAKNYALSMIYKRFLENKVSNKEEIIDIELCYQKENLDSFYFTFLVTKNENIARCNK